MSAVPVDGGWCIKDAITHLRDAQVLFEFRVNLMIEQEHPKLESKAVFDMVGQSAERTLSTEDFYQSYLESRQRVIARLDRLPLRDWWRTGQHQEFGGLTITQQASYFAAHELTHFPQIERLVTWQKNLE